MSTKPKDGAMDLMDLLPAIYRIRDAESKGQLQAILNLLEEQVSMIKEDIDSLWDDLFIETCAPWVVPYIGEIVGNRPMNYLDRTARVDVAKTIYYRRRKGTLTMLEDLARDVTGWDARAVAFFENLNWTQNMEHQRFTPTSAPTSAPGRVDGVERVDRVDRVGTLNLSNPDLLDRIDGPFDGTSRTVDVRRMDAERGRFAINRIGFFLWRLKSFRIEAAPAVPAGPDGAYYFSPVKLPLRLFSMRGDAGGYAGPAEERDVAAPIRPLRFHESPDDYYGHGRSLAVYLGAAALEEALIPVTKIRLMDLDEWQKPPEGMIGLDLIRGRLQMGSIGAVDQGITVSYCYGFSAELGGGPYRRLFGQEVGPEQEEDERPPILVGGDQGASTIGQAISFWVEGVGDVIEITDSGIYREDLVIEAGEPGAKRSLEIRARDMCRPVIMGSVFVRGSLSDLRIGGVMICGSLRIEGAGYRVDRLSLSHTTIVPGRGGIYSSVSGIGSAEISFCITGQMRLSSDMSLLRITDSIVDAGSGRAISGVDGLSFGPRLSIERSTVFGSIDVRLIEMASESIFTESVRADQSQSGCVRYCSVSSGSIIPRRFRCVPEEEPPEGVPVDESDSAIPIPDFVSKTYGHQSYAALSDRSPEEILKGAEDGSEMGAFCHLKRSQRAANLQIRLQEYLPAGLESGMIFVN